MILKGTFKVVHEEESCGTGYGEIIVSISLNAYTKQVIARFDLFMIDLDIVAEFVESLKLRYGEVYLSFIGGTKKKEARLDLDFEHLNEGNIIGTGTISGTFNSIIDDGDVGFIVWQSMPTVYSTVIDKTIGERGEKEILENNTLHLYKGVEWWEYLDNRIDNYLYTEIAWPNNHQPEIFDDADIEYVNSQLPASLSGLRILKSENLNPNNHETELTESDWVKLVLSGKVRYKNTEDSINIPYMCGTCVNANASTDPDSPCKTCYVGGFDPLYDKTLSKMYYEECPSKWEFDSENAFFWFEVIE